MIDPDQLAERYRANHARLLAARDRLQAAVDAGIATDEERKRLDTVTELLTPVTVTVDVDGRVTEVQCPRQFLEVDPDGQGRAVEVLGDLEQAQNVAILVPGMGNSLDTLRGQSDRGVPGQRMDGRGRAGRERPLPRDRHPRRLRCRRTRVVDGLADHAHRGDPGRAVI